MIFGNQGTTAGTIWSLWPLKG